METNLSVNAPVKSFVQNNPRSAEVFEELNIDFCCGGDTSLLSASEDIGLEPHRVFNRLMALPALSSKSEKCVSKIESVFSDVNPENAENRGVTLHFL